MPPPRKASRNKYGYDPEQAIFTLSKVLPEGMVFPHDFGFLPRTLAADGDQSMCECSWMCRRFPVA
jgi:inorganic pyrophosphatase